MVPHYCFWTRSYKEHSQNARGTRPIWATCSELKQGHPLNSISRAPSVQAYFGAPLGVYQNGAFSNTNRYNVPNVTMSALGRPRTIIPIRTVLCRTGATESCAFGCDSLPLVESGSLELRGFKSQRVQTPHHYKGASSSKTISLLPKGSKYPYSTYMGPDVIMW